MELQQLKNFYVIAECESLTKAAQKLHVSQPTLSRSLRALEDELGALLFDRVGRNVVLNDAGRIALERINIVLNSAETVKEDVEKYVHDKSLTVDFYCPVPMGDNEGIIINFKKKYPNIRLRMASRPLERLKTIRPNITFFASPIIHKKPNYLALGEEEIVLVVSRNHPLAECSSVELSSLANEQFIEVLGSPLSNLTSSMFLEAGFEPNTIMEESDYNHILAYVANDFGIALAPAITWFGKEDGRLVKIPISDVHRKRYLYLKWPENTVMGWATLRFRKYLIEHFNKNYGFTCAL